MTEARKDARMLEFGNGKGGSAPKEAYGNQGT
jgi:hypothetical protein